VRRIPYAVGDAVACLVDAERWLPARIVHVRAKPLISPARWSRCALLRSRRVVSRRIASHRVALRRVVSRRIASRCVVSCRVVSCRDGGGRDQCVCSKVEWRTCAAAITTDGPIQVRTAAAKLSRRAAAWLRWK
jgi:hypothetical protein